MGMVAVAINWLVRLKVAKDRKWTNTGSGRYLLGAYAKCADKVGIWYQGNWSGPNSFLGPLVSGAVLIGSGRITIFLA